MPVRNPFICLIVCVVTALPASPALSSLCFRALPPPPPPPPACPSSLPRHAERAGGAGAMANDDPLSPAGRERAELLSRILSDAGVHSIFVTEYKRSQETAA